MITDEKNAYAHYFKINNGSIVHAQTIELRKKMEETDEELLLFSILEFRNRFGNTSKEILVPFEPEIVTDKQNLPLLTQSMKLESAKSELLDFLKTAPLNKEGGDKNCSIPTAEEVLNEFSKSLSNYGNDNERFSAFKKKYEEFCYPVSQIKLILTQFIHDREKLDVAKMLYFYCTDKQKYLSIKEVFNYNTSVAEITEFVNLQKK